MHRREFITLLGSAAATWPLAARAQQGERVRRIGMLTGVAGEDAHTKVRTSAFVGAATSGLDRGPQRADRHPHGRGKSRKHPQVRGRVGVACA